MHMWDETCLTDDLKKKKYSDEQGAQFKEKDNGTTRVGRGKIGLYPSFLQCIAKKTTHLVVYNYLQTLVDQQANLLQTRWMDQIYPQNYIIWC